MGLFSRSTHDGTGHNDGYDNNYKMTAPATTGVNNTYGNSTVGSYPHGLHNSVNNNNSNTGHHSILGGHRDHTSGTHHSIGNDAYNNTTTGHHGIGHHHDNVENTYNSAATTGGVGTDGYNGTTTTHNGIGTHNHNTLHNEKGLRNNTSRRRSRGLGAFFSNRRRSRSRTKPPMFDEHSSNYNRRPSFGQWLKYTWPDILTMVILGAVGLGVYEADPAPTRSFPVTFQDGSTVYPQFAYPLRKEIIPIWAAAMLGSLVPIFFFLVMQIRIRSFWDVNNAVIGLLYSLITAAVFQVFIKWLIGGLRPHFLDVCQPDVSRIEQGGNGFRSLMFTTDICTGDRNQINDSLESMPSGHSTAAFAGFIFLYLYLNAKLKVFSNHHPAMWKLVVTYAPVLAACLIAGALTIDEFHNWYDCLAGAVIGTVMAFSAYRMVYASIWDFRFNHIPLTRHTPFSYGAGSAGAAGFETAVFTRAAGWGYEEAYGGAPFDAAHHLRGSGGPAGVGGSTLNNHRGRDSGHYRAGDVEYNSATPAGTTTATADNRYRSHRKSLERKALPTAPRPEETY